MKALSFDDTDLAANQNGDLSDAQIALLQRKRRESLAYVITAAISFIGFLATLHVWALYIPQIALATALILAIKAGLTFYQYSRDLADHNVKCAEGTAQLDVVGAGAGTQNVKCTLTIDGVKFPITKEQMLALRHGYPYALYYTSGTKHLLSMEPLADYGYEKPKRLERQTQNAIDSVDTSELELQHVHLSDDGELISNDSVERGSKPKHRSL